MTSNKKKGEDFFLWNMSAKMHYISFEKKNLYQYLFSLKGFWQCYILAKTLKHEM